MALVAAVLVGFLAARLTWLAARPWFLQPSLRRPNYRNRSLPTATGLVIPVALLVVEAGRSVASSLGTGEGLDGPRLLVMVAAIGFGLLGVVDDVAGSGDYRGFRGHVLALFAGHLTTGAFKLLGGTAVALVVVGPWAGGSLGRLLADGALVALSANLGNLFDRAPGRVLKVSALAFVALVVAAGFDPALVGPAVVVGAGLGLALDDLREHLMLGDAGANVLGAVLGLAAVLTLGPATRNLVLAVVVVLNLVGEVASFSRLIDSLPPLRALDQAGRRPRPSSGRSSG